MNLRIFTGALVNTYKLAENQHKADLKARFEE